MRTCLRPEWSCLQALAGGGLHGHVRNATTLDTCSNAIPAMQEEAAALIAGLVLATK